jgi:hypothetical protein
MLDGGGSVSWETLVSGEVDFRKGTNKKEREEIIKKVKETLELPYRKREVGWGAYNEKKYKEMFWFIHVNWASHVDEEKVKNLLKELKQEGKVEEAVIGLRYLTDDTDEELFSFDDV